MRKSGESNFDKEFTGENPRISQTDKLFIMNIDQTQFEGFSFVNTEFIVNTWRGKEKITIVAMAVLL